MDDLLNSALKFKELLNTSYVFHLGHKKNLYIIELSFSKSDFFHLAGLQYLRDINQLRQNKQILFDKVLTSQSLRETIEKSVFYDEISDRICGLQYLEEMLDSPYTKAFKFNYNAHSKINADYLFLYNANLNTRYMLYYVVKEKETLIHHGCSFISTNIDKSKEHIALTILQKDKIVSGTTTNLYLSKNYIKTFGQIISKAREEKGLSISDVGKAINKNVLCLEYMEKDIHKPTKHSVHVLAEFYGLDEDKLQSSITATVHYDREGLEKLKNQGR